MTDTPDMFECRLVGYSKQARKDGDWIECRFQIHPDDVTPALAQAPLKTAFMIAAVPVESGAALAQTTRASEAAHEKPKRKWEDISLPEQAGIRCEDEEFQTWLENRHDWAVKMANRTESQSDITANRVRSICGVQSRTEIQYGTVAADSWLNLDQEYQDAAGLITERME